MDDTEGPVAQRSGDFAILLPPGWLRLSVDPQFREPLVPLVNSRVQHLPAEKRESARRVLTRELTQALDSADRAGGIELLICVEGRGGIPIPASCLVSHIEHDGPVSIQDIARTAEDEDNDVSIVSIGGEPAVRRRTARLIDPTDVSDTARMTEDMPSVLLTEVHFYVPWPGGSGVLVFSFSTTSEALAPALTNLFDAMADSIRWM